MEENKELETTTEEQASVTQAANNGEKKGLFLSGLIVGFAATLLIVGGIFIAFQIHNIMTMKDDVAAQVSYGEDSAVNAQTIKKLQLLEDTVKENFYLSEVTNEQLEDGMFRGLMDSLDDPYSEYYTAEELNRGVHPYELNAEANVILRLNAIQLGVGGDDGWTRLVTHEQYRPHAPVYRYGFILGAVTSDDDTTALARSWQTSVAAK